MKKTILLLAILSLISCKKSDDEIIRYDSAGVVITKSYLDSNQKLDSLIQFEKGKIIFKMYFNKLNANYCYVKQFDDKGKPTSEGKYIYKTRLGKWKFYDSKMRIKRIVEYINLCGKTHLNQEWDYDEKGKLDINKSSYFTYKIDKQSIILDGEKVNNLKIFFIPGFKKGSVCTINLSQEINKNFCNVDSVEKFSLKSDDKFTFTIPIKSDDLNRKFNLKGYIEENHFDDSVPALGHRIRRVYIDVPIKI